MIHKMNLAPAPFKYISLGKKTVEMRLYDEKRSKINVGDEIEFENIDTHQKIKCAVVNLTRYKDFLSCIQIIIRRQSGMIKMKQLTQRICMNITLSSRLESMECWQ